MGNPKAFLEIHRQEAGYRPIHDRIHDFGEVEQTLSTRGLVRWAIRHLNGTTRCIKATGNRLIDC